MSLIKNNDKNNFYPITVEGTDWHCDYLWSTHEGNFNGSGCEFECSYCSRSKYNKRFKKPSGLHWLKTEWEKWSLGYLLKRQFLSDSTYFVDPYTDLFTFENRAIKHILGFCHDSNSVKHSKFILQTKKPEDYFDYLDLIPEGSWLGTTIGSNFNRLGIEPNAPVAGGRQVWMRNLSNRYNKFITIEPIMSFELSKMIKWMAEIKPDLIFIGANTSKVSLPEPTPDELVALIEKLREITTVYLKSNLKRLLPEGYRYE